MSVKIPQKSSFKLEEICEITGVRPYILRFWESEFDEIQPITSASGQKVYEHKDVEAILRIKSLLVDQKLTMPKAKKSLASNRPFDLHGTAYEGEDLKDILDESNLQKLVLAKAKLQSIITKTQSVQNLLNGAK